MRKSLLFFSILFATAYSANTQTLFTYGAHAVSKQEFLQAYNKNPDTSGNREQKLKEYLDLYINFKLKLQAAYDEKANTNADLKTESENFKAQLADNFINQQANISLLMHEAFLRSQKNILVKQVFISLPDDKDTTAAFGQITKAYNELHAGKNFEDVTIKYSNDSSVKAVRGKIGYITVFTLPYSIENIIYNLKPGEFSTIYKSAAGYHIFQNAGERDAPGSRKIEQLLFATPSFFSVQQMAATKQLADSVYKILQAGTSTFASFLPAYGHINNDDGDANSNTIEVKVGEYTDDFEQQVFNLKNVDDISAPFKTDYGYNIIKLDAISQVPKDENDISFAAQLQTQIQSDGRLNTAKKSLINQWLVATGFKQAKYNTADLWAYTDNASKTAGLPPATYKDITPETVLFSFTKKKIYVKDWMSYLEFTGYTTDNNKHDYNSLMKDYISSTCDEYYRTNIEDFDTAATAQLKEFDEANLLFYVMNEHVWNKASEDSAGLEKYYQAHKTDYKWQQSVTALVISTPEKNLASVVADKIKANPAEWRKTITPYGDKVYADSSRFELDQLPVKEKVIPQKDYQTIVETAGSGDAYTFIHVFNYYATPEEKSYTDAKGLVINDYQQQLENKWIDSLKKTYPVTVNNTVANTLQ